MTVPSPTIDPALLQPGDILLMRGIGAISDLIAWFGDSPYSHAGIMVSRTELVEAAVPRSHRMLLANKLASKGHYAFIDAYRATDAQGHPLPAGAAQAIADAAAGLVNTSYPLNILLPLAIYGALRNRIPMSAVLRLALRDMLREFRQKPDAGMVCSQLVYEAFKRIDRAPMVIVNGALDLPFPDVDWKELIDEWWSANGKPRIAGMAEAGISEEALAEEYAAYRRDAGPAMMATMPSALGSRVSNPASIDVMPLDLSASPQIRMLGRLPLTG